LANTWRFIFGREESIFVNLLRGYLMNNTFELTAELRQDLGKGASRRLRRLADKVPAILYGGDAPAVSLSFPHKDIKKALENEAFYSHILTIHLNGEKHQAVLKALQRHPYKPRIQHMDFLRITGKEKIQMTVPLHFVGEDVAPGVKQKGGIISHLLNNVEIRCLPTNLPEYIEIDVSNLDLDESIHLSAIKLPESVELVALLHGDDRSVVSIHLPRAATAEEATPAAASEVPAVKAKSNNEKAGK
jgi:large subunit ribosomal protein L25